LQPPTERPRIVAIVARVYGEVEYHASVADDGGSFVVRTPAEAERRGVRVVLSASLSDGRAATARNAFGIEGSPDLSRAEIEEQIDRVLGRAGRRPPRLAWGPLSAALESVGLTSSEAELIDAPLEICFAQSAEPGD
jgi:hypothetical protein